MVVLGNCKRILAVLAIALFLGAYVLVGWLLPMTQPVPASGVDGGFVGLSVHSLSVSDAQLVNESGAKWIRIDASDELSDFNVSLRNAKAYNLSVLAILDSWMFGMTTVFSLEDWQSNVTHYVSGYADYVDAWEIWNEPAHPAYPVLNLDLNYSNPQYKDNLERIVDFYYSMAKIAHEIIRQYDPTAKILLFGGLHLWSGGGNDPSLDLDKSFYNQITAKNIFEFGDGIAVHAYPWTGGVTQSVWNGYTDTLAYYHSLFPSNKTLEVWVTETGQSVNDSGIEGQKQYIADALDYFEGKVTHIFWYSLQDNTAMFPEEKCFGLLTSDSSPRPAYYELQNHLEGTE